MNMEMKKRQVDADFCVRQYGRQELALCYFPLMTKRAAWKKLRRWMMVNPRLRQMVWHRGDGPLLRTFTPREVRLIVEELGEP